MPVNVDPETGIRYGILDGQLMPELCARITERGTDVIYEKAKADVRAGLQADLSDIDESDLPPLAERATCFEQIFTTALRRVDQRQRAADLVTEFVDLGSGTFDIDEVIDSVLEDFNQHWDNSWKYRLEEDGFVYELVTHSGLCLWVLKSPFKVATTLCSPCAPNAGDLAREGGYDTYCPGPEALESWVPPGAIERVA